MAVKAKEIAKMVGVSEATLSLVINAKPGISDKTRTAVIQKLRELGYSHMLKQDAVSGHSLSAADDKIIAFVLFKNRGELLGMNSFFPLILDGLEIMARRYGYALHVISVEAEDIRSQIHYIHETRCQGFVLFATELHKDQLQYFEDTGLPFVMLDNYFIDKSICTVKVNNQQGIYLALRHLKENGHRKIGYLSSGLDINSFHERRMMAVNLALQMGLEDMQEYSFTIGYPNENAEIGMARVLEEHEQYELPTAFLADNDLVSAGAIRAAKDAGYKVPDDFSFVGYDDRPICTVISPKLTTVQLPREQFGGAAIGQLINMIEFKSGSCFVTEVGGNLIVRDSVKKIG